MKGSDKKKAIFAGILMLIAAAWLYSAFSPSTPASAPATTKRQGVMAALASDEAAAKAGAAKRAKGTTADGSDPSLQLDLLTKLQATSYEGSNRNIFQFYAPPPPEPPKLVAPVVVAGGNNSGGPVAPPSPPPPPAIPLKFYGLASVPGVAPKKAFLQSQIGEDISIYIAMEGDVVNKRYKVVRINDNSIEMEDTQNNSKQKLPLQES